VNPVDIPLRGSRPQPTHDSPLAANTRYANPSKSWCFRCGMPWGVVKEHSTIWSSKGQGCFPLCEGCWSLLGSPEARIEYYKMLIDWWNANEWTCDEDEQRAIQRAVANGG
jgi:hypothetical protein